MADQTSSRTFHVNGGGAQFTSALPVNSVATYTWSPNADSVREWLTSTSGSILTTRLAEQPSIAMSSAAPAGAATLTVDPTATHQTMTGFGGAMTDSAATLITNSPNKNSIMNALFSASGDRLNFVRVPVGASDLVASRYESYDDSSTSDPTLSNFSISHDQTNILPLLRTVKQLSPGTTVLAVPWSAPGWMKSGGTFYGKCGNGNAQNTLNPIYYKAYAQYLAKFVNAYRDAGVGVNLLSLQNEPEHCASDYPSMNLTASQEATLAGYVSSAVGSGTGLLGWDHNWYDEGSGSGSAPTTFPQSVVTQAGGSISAVGYHCYNSNGTSAAYATQMTGIPVYMTECSGFVDKTNAGVNLVNEVRNDLLGPIEYGARGSLYWSLAQGTDGSPHVGGCATCRGMVGINRATGDYAPSEDYYYWGQFSKFVDKGAVRIDSSDLGVNSLQSVAFRNPDGSIAMVVLNGSQNYTGHIVQWDGDTKAQKTAWLVGPDGQRRWINDTATYNCLKNQGAPGPDSLPDQTLDTLPDATNVWAVCGVDRVGVNSMLQSGFYLRSANGQYTLRLTGSNLSLTNSAGTSIWSTGRGGDDLTLQSDGNLVQYVGKAAVWSSGTSGSGAQWLVLTDAGKLALYNSAGAYVWTNEGTPASHSGQIVHWDGDTKTQKTAWLVGPDGQRRWIHDTATYNCLKASGAAGPEVLTSWELNQMPDVNNVWAVCGLDRIGVNSMLQSGFYARSADGGTTLRLTASALTLSNAAGKTLWSSGHGGSELVLQTDGNLVEYAGSTAVWASDTVGSGAVWMVVGNDGTLGLFNAAGDYVWTSEGPPSTYVGHLVQWEGDTNTQKTAWLVGPDGHRHWISDAATFNCLKAHGSPGPDVLTSWELNQLPDSNGSWAACS